MTSSTEDTRRERPKPQIQLKTVDLCVVSGPDVGQRASFCLPMVRVGTATDNDFVLTDPYVSRHHLELRITPEGFVLRDLWSTNGTFIGSRRVTETYLEPEVFCTLGHSRLSIRQRTEEHSVPVPVEQKHLGDLVGASQRMRELYSLICAAAPTQATVLLEGESGSGKELVARTIHELSGRTGPLVVFDASVTDPEMIRDDLFGHVKGAFTGAAYSREGAFRRAHRGTLFIDEVGELPLDLQPRLLRILENREVTPVGSDQPVRVDVRVIAATNRDLEAMVQTNCFRADLFYRLSVIVIKVPALREIMEDLPLLVEHLINKLSLNCRVSPEAMATLRRYHWPGNVRELRNVLERAAVLGRGEEIRPGHLGLPEIPESQADFTAELLKPIVSAVPLAPMREFERKMILDTLVRNRHNVEKTAQELGISIATLKRKLKALKGSNPTTS